VYAYNKSGRKCGPLSLAASNGFPVSRCLQAPATHGVYCSETQAAGILRSQCALITSGLVLQQHQLRAASVARFIGGFFSRIEMEAMPKRNHVATV